MKEQHFISSYLLSIVNSNENIEMNEKKLNKILMAEDEEDIRRIAKIALEQIGHYTILLCESGGDVLRVVDHFNPDLILLDVMMPGMDGVMTYKALRKKQTFANTPIVFMTAKVQQNEINKYIELGAAGVIHKPFDPLALPERINQIWGDYVKGSNK